MDNSDAQSWRKSITVFGVALMCFMSGMAAQDPEPTGESSAIRELIRRGAVVKRFEVKETETTGQLVRMKAEHLDHDGCLMLDLLDPLLRLPHVAVEFRGLPFSDAGLKQLALKTRLIGLDLSGTNVTDRGLLELIRGDLPHRDSLRLLDLSFTRVTDDGLSSIAKLRRLRHLSVIECAVTDTGIESLSALLELREAYVRKTRVTAAAASRWRRSAPKCRIED